MEGGHWVLETELAHSFINLFNKYLPSPMLGTGYTVVNTTHGLCGIHSLLGRQISKNQQTKQQSISAIREITGC